MEKRQRLPSYPKPRQPHKHKHQWMYTETCRITLPLIQLTALRYAVYAVKLTDKNRLITILIILNSCKYLHFRANK